jgi:2,6-dihydroxypyridine 3-monooxygenase
MGKAYAGFRAAVVGGSIGGLSAALLLRDLGFEVDIYERTPEELEGRGAGIVLQPEMQRWFTERSTHRPEEISAVSKYLRYFGPGNEIVYEEPSVWRFTSWGTLYRALLSDFGRERYHLGHCVVGVDTDAEGATLRFTNGTVVNADLAVFADGVTSTGRKRLLPGVGLEYSGYVGWRGTVPESELSRETLDLLQDSLSYSIGSNTHICVYPIPGPHDELDYGKRLINYVWYRNVPAGAELEELLTDKSGFRGDVSVHPGKVQDRFVAEVKQSAADLLAPAAAEVVQATEFPYLQLVADVRVPKMTFGRTVILGDAAFVGRPHGAAGTAKAAYEAWGLAEALELGHGDITTSLAAWEPVALKTGSALVDRVVAMGRRSQFENSWDPVDQTLRFGLHGPLLPIS